MNKEWEVYNECGFDIKVFIEYLIEQINSL